MASPESSVLKDLYRGWIETLDANPDLPIDKVRLLFEHWGDVTGERRQPAFCSSSFTARKRARTSWTRPGTSDRAL